MFAKSAVIAGQPKEGVHFGDAAGGWEVCKGSCFSRVCFQVIGCHHMSHVSDGLTHKGALGWFLFEDSFTKSLEDFPEVLQVLLNVSE